MADGSAGGEWWRVDGPWRVLGRSAAGAAGEGESVYAPEVPVESPVQFVKEPAAPAPGASAPDSWPPSRSLTAADFPGWDSVHFDFTVAGPQAEAPAAPAAPEQPVVGSAEAEPSAGAAAPSRRALMAGRRPSALVVLSALVLLGGAVTGQPLALLAGWGLGYLAPRLGDLTRKFAVLGIPLATMAGSTVWFWGRAKGRWGAPVAQGSQLGHVAWAAAPGVLRLAGVLSALFLLAVTLRRRRSAE